MRNFCVARQCPLSVLHIITMQIPFQKDSILPQTQYLMYSPHYVHVCEDMYTYAIAAYTILSILMISSTDLKQLWQLSFKTEGNVSL